MSRSRFACPSKALSITPCPVLKGVDVFLIDPFDITGTSSHGMNGSTLSTRSILAVTAAARSMTEMLVVSTGAEHDPHWTDPS
jgi:hypothetical protein